MRLNGTYLDRLLIIVLPVIVIGGIIIYFTYNNFLDTFFFTCIVLLLWVIDCIIIHFKKLATLKVNGNIFLGDYELLPENILEITPLKGSRRLWMLRLIKFKIRTENLEMTLDIMSKPLTLIVQLKGKNSRTLDTLFESFPQLKTKLTPPQ